MRRSFQVEEEFVAWLAHRVRTRAVAVRVGVGDDAAVVELKPNKQQILTSDLTIEGIHFSRRLHPPAAVGHRALARSLSDVAAMGGKPRFALVSLQLSRQADRAWVEAFFRGMNHLARRFGVAIVGGDTAVTTGHIAVDVTVIGEVDRGKALLRAGAKPGDSVLVAGTLGLSAVGLLLLRTGSESRHRAAVRAHLYPEPQCGLGQFLVSRRLASAAIDISDGLSTDLARLLRASHAGARVWEDRIPKPRLAMPGHTALALALNGGEDYKLLFTASPRQARQLPAAFEGAQVHEIGTVCKSRHGITIEGPNGSRRLRPAGYDHFRAQLK